MVKYRIGSKVITIAGDVCEIVKIYRGSLFGEIKKYDLKSLDNSSIFKGVNSINFKIVK